MIKKLDAQTLKDLYEREMKDTFPRAELKPLKAMLRMQADGHYDALGYYDERNRCTGSPTPAPAQPARQCSWIILPSSPSHRGEGLGSRFL